jgi:hypothetical protein
VDPRSRGHRLHEASYDTLPDGAFVRARRRAVARARRQPLRWTPAGYASAVPRPARGQARLITPPSLVEVLRADWQPLVPLLHPSALDGG